MPFEGEGAPNDIGRRTSLNPTTASVMNDDSGLPTIMPLSMFTEVTIARNSYCPSAEGIFQG